MTHRMHLVALLSLSGAAGLGGLMCGGEDKGPAGGGEQTGAGGSGQGPGTTGSGGSAATSIPVRDAAPALAIKPGIWNGTTSDGAAVSFSVEASGGPVVSFALAYANGCQSQSQFKASEPYPIVNLSFDSPSNSVTVGGQTVANPYARLTNAFLSATTAQGTFWFAGSTTTKTSKTCINMGTGGCLEWKTESSSCVSSGEGTWQAAWAADPPSSPASAGCGNGSIESGEVCDDGNAAAGDGCTSDCRTVEVGWLCPMPGSPCVNLDGR